MNTKTARATRPPSTSEQKRNLRPAGDLDRLAVEIKAEHELAEKAWESAVEHAVRCGLLLIEAKPLCGRGNFRPWLREVGIPERTARRYMQAAKTANLADLPPTLSDALEGLEARRERRELDTRQSRIKAMLAEYERVCALVHSQEKDSKLGVQMLLGDPSWAIRVIAANIEAAAVLLASPRCAKSLDRSTLAYLRTQLEAMLRELPEAERRHTTG